MCSQLLKRVLKGFNSKQFTMTSDINRTIAMNEAIAPRSPSFLLGFDPGRDKCGIAVRNDAGQFVDHEVVPAEGAIAHLITLCQRYPIERIVMGNQTTAKQWQAQIQQALPDMAIALVDERYSTLEARDRYWQLYPPQNLQKFLPQSLRSIPRPIDDIVAMLLIERYLVPHINNL